MYFSSGNSVFFLLFGLWRSINNQNVHGFTFKVDQQKILTDNDRKIELNFPIVVNTWPFTNATAKAWSTLVETDSALQAVQDGCTECEELRCDGTVGWGGSPDEAGESTLDALIMDGPTHSAGSVASMKRVKNAIGVARAVMNYTKHTLLVGEAATRFAVEMGFQQEDIHSVESMESWIQWYTNRCQPNFRINVSPDPERFCGPYKPLESLKYTGKRFNEHVSQKSHDTIGMIAINSKGDMATGTSTNGATHKIPGYI
jgi:N4-(beta-N-acetylglucosaminyl)-L-asparaginase